MEKITVSIVGRHTLFREGIERGLSTYQDVEMMFGWASTDMALSLIEAFFPRVVLLCVDDPFQSEIDLGHQITTRCPETAVIALVSNPDDDQIFEAIKAGATACVSDDVSFEELASVIRRVAQGERPIDEILLVRPRVVDRVLRQFLDIFLRAKATETEATPDKYPQPSPQAAFVQMDAIGLLSGHER